MVIDVPQRPFTASPSGKVGWGIAGYDGAGGSVPPPAQLALRPCLGDFVATLRPGAAVREPEAATN